MHYRIEGLSEAAGVSVDTIRFYQKQSLLPPPRREGRVALYDDEHRARLGRIRELQAAGFRLRVVKRVLDGDLWAGDESLASGGSPPARSLSLAELATETGVALPLLEAALREGILPLPPGGQFSPSDAVAIKTALEIVGQGLPIPEVMELARRHHERITATAEEAVRLFDEHIREPLHTGAAVDSRAAAEKLVEAFRALLPAATEVVAWHFRHVLLDRAWAHIETAGSPDELAATRAEHDRMGGMG